MKKRLLSLVLCLVMVFSLFPAFGMNAAAADANGITNPDTAQDSTGQLNLTKELEPGQNGAYDLTMESWATGEVHAFTEKIPTDFVVVVDQSGSMAYKDMPVKYNNAGTVQLETIAAAAEPTPGTANANGYYYKAADGNYYRVYPVRDYLYEYVPGNTLYAYNTTPASARQWFSESENASFTAKNSIFCLDDDGNFYQLYFDIYGKFLKYNVKPHYTRNDGSVQWFTPPEDPWFHKITNGSVCKPGDGGYWLVKGYWNDLFGGNDKYVFQELGGIRGGTIFDFPMYWRHTGYSQLAYRDTDGEVHIIPANDGTETTRFCNSSGEAVTTNGGSTKMMYNNLYTYNKPTNESRETALKKALTRFASAVAGETDSFGPVDNRVSIVGFSSPDTNNTEVLTNTDRNLPSTYNGWQKTTADANASEYYGKALVGATNGTVGTVNGKITSAINAITSNGGTQPEDGLNMAYQILDNRGDYTTYTIRSGDHEGDTVKRNTVVIFFTDGQPGDFDNSNQYKEANDVVAQAYNIKTLKDKKDNKPLNTTIFSIGVFGESDGNPLTYEAHSTYSENEDYEFDLGYVKTVGSYSYLNRNWLQNNAAHYGSTPNDTIFDYMSVVSSNYPAATQFMKIKTSNTAGEADTTGYADYLAMCAGVRGTSVQGNQFYRLASNQDTLIAAFLEAATMHNEESGTNVVLDDSAVLKDQVNLADFDATGASVTAKVCNMHGTEDSALTQLLTIDDSALATNGTATVTGFDYAENYGLNGAGKKLVVTISGLTPKKATGTLKSNADTDELLAAGVYGAGIEKPTVSIVSPTLTLSGDLDKTYIIDFNAAMKVATGATQLKVDARENPNGTFNKANNGDVTYKLGGGLNGNTFTASYSGVDSALVYGQPVGETATGWTKITTVPANNIYFDDDLTQLTATENGVGFNSGVGVLKEETTAVGTYSFTFTGSRIDIYCTTDGDASAVTAVLKEGDKVIKRKAISNKYQDAEIGALYNVPSVVFEAKDGVVAGHTYTVTLTAKQDSYYKLDGVRVYKAVAETGDVKTAYENAQEANSTFLKVRDYLLTSSMISTLNQYIDDLAAYNALEDKEGVEPPAQPENIPGIAFYKDVAYEEGADQYAKLADYVKTGPKNEIYLANGEVVSFAIKNCPNDMQVWIGLSAPDGKTGSIEVNDEAYTPDIASTVDMYYKVTPKEIDGEQTLKIKNVGSSLISITNVKITGSNATNPSLNATVLSVTDAEPADGAPYLAVTPKLLARMSAPAQAEDPQPTPTADPEPTEDPTPTQQPSIVDWISNLFSSFVNSLFGSISRLFGN